MSHFLQVLARHDVFDPVWVRRGHSVFPLEQYSTPSQQQWQLKYSQPGVGQVKVWAHSTQSRKRVCLIWCCRTSEIVWKTEFQKWPKEGQDQSMWSNVPGVLPLLPQVGSTSGYMCDNRTLDKCTPCTILKWMSACGAHVDAVWTRPRIDSHSWSVMVILRSCSCLALIASIGGHCRFVIKLYNNVGGAVAPFGRLSGKLLKKSEAQTEGNFLRWEAEPWAEKTFYFALFVNCRGVEVQGTAGNCVCVYWSGSNALELILK